MARLAIVLFAFLVVIYYFTLLGQLFGFMQVSTKTGFRKRWALPFLLWFSAKSSPRKPEPIPEPPVKAKKKPSKRKPKKTSNPT